MIWTRARWSVAILSSLAFATTSAAQTGNGRVTGTITDRTAGAPISNVAITVVGTTLGARSGTDGKFTINEVPAGAQRLRAARIGYSPADQLVNLTPGQTATVNIALSTATVTLDQMVVTGYGQQRRSDLTGALRSIREKMQAMRFNVVSNSPAAFKRLIDEERRKLSAIVAKADLRQD